MINEDRERVYVEIATALNSEGFDQASDALNALKGQAETVGGTLKRLLDVSGARGTGGLAATAAEQLQIGSLQGLLSNTGAGHPERLTADQREQERLTREELDRTDFLLSQKGQLYETFFGKRRTELADWDRDSTHTEQQRWLHNREIVRKMDREWYDLSRTVAGGFREAMAITESDGTNWTRNWLGFLESATSKGASAFQSFFTSTSSGFLNLETLCKDVFTSIWQAFADMISRMAAKAAILSVFKAGGLFSGDIFTTILGSFDTGGPVRATGAYQLHQGEFVLPPSVVSAIKEDRIPQADYSCGAGGAAGISMTINAPVTINGNAEAAQARAIASEIAEAARRGATWAVEHSKITYKVGQSRTAEAAL